MNLLTSPPRRSTSSTTTPKKRLRTPTTSAASWSEAYAVDPTRSMNSTDATRVSPPSSTSPVADRGRGGRDIVADVPAEQVPQLLPLPETTDHLVEPALQGAQLGAVVDDDVGVELAFLHRSERLAHGLDRRDHRAGVEVGEDEPVHQHRPADDDRDDRQLVQAGLVAAERGPRIAATSRPATGTAVPIAQNITIRGPTPDEPQPLVHLGACECPGGDRAQRELGQQVGDARDHERADCDGEASRDSARRLQHDREDREQRAAERATAPAASA